MSSNRVQLITRLTPEQCVSRLTAAVDNEGWLFSFAGLFGSRPVVGRVTESSLRLRKRIGYRNSFQSFLAATMRREPTGTVISGKVAMHSFVRAFMFVWFAGVIFIGGGIFVAAVGSMFSASSHQQQHAWLGVIFPLVMLAFGYGLLRFGRYLARDEARFLTDFLTETLDAREVN